jgi:hypothetical protein
MSQQIDKTSLLRFARGCYQRALILGQARWSGADLRGRARQFCDRYADSRRNLIRRIQRAGIPASIRPINSHGKLDLVID